MSFDLKAGYLRVWAFGRVVLEVHWSIGARPIYWLAYRRSRGPLKYIIDRVDRGGVHSRPLLRLPKLPQDTYDPCLLKHLPRSVVGRSYMNAIQLGG